MRNIDKYLSLLDGEVDGLLLTSPYSRYYGAEFEISEGVAVVSKKGCRYFTDSRYIEAAENTVKCCDVAEGRQVFAQMKDYLLERGITDDDFVRECNKKLKEAICG